MSAIKKYLSLVKFSHTIFAMPFAVIGFFLGITSYGYLASLFKQNETVYFSGYVPQFSNYPASLKEILTRFVLVIGCMVFARSAAMAFNRYLDRNFDAKNPRTAIREIPSGIISKESALRFVVINCLLFVTASRCNSSNCDASSSFNFLTGSIIPRCTSNEIFVFEFLPRLVLMITTPFDALDP